MRKISVRLALLVAAALALPCPALALSPRSVKRSVERALDRPAFASGFWGVEIRSLESGRTLYERNASRNFKPASTFKLLTTAAALDALGPDARFRTTVETGGRMDGLGRILGDVYLVGRGDPNLSGRFTDGRRTAAFEALADALAASGVRRIEGRLVGHEGYFRGERRGDTWAWEDLVWCYGAEVSALSFNDNCVTVAATPGERAGDPLLVEAQPTSSYYRIVSSATTTAAGAESDLTLVREPGSNLIRLSGTHPLGAKPWEESVALEDPARYAVTVFAEVLERKGIHVTGGTGTSSDPLPAPQRLLASHEGPPLSEVLKEINKESQNLHTEMLLRVLGAEVKGEGSLAKGHEALKEFLGRVGVTPETGALQDASGLSRSDLFVPHEIVNLLAAMDRHSHARVFRESLPVAGVDGTLKNRMKGTAAEGRVQAKTGTLRHVNALAGYLTTLQGERLVFSFVINHHTVPGREATAAMDALLAELVTQ